MAQEIQILQEVEGSVSDDDDNDEDVLNELLTSRDHYHCLIVMGTRASRKKVEVAKVSRREPTSTSSPRTTATKQNGKRDPAALEREWKYHVREHWAVSMDRPLGEAGGVCVGGYSQIILAVRNALEWQQKPTSAMVSSVQEIPRYQGTIAGKVLSHVIIDPGSNAITA